MFRLKKSLYLKLSTILDTLFLTMYPKVEFLKKYVLSKNVANGEGGGVICPLSIEGGSYSHYLVRDDICTHRLENQGFRIRHNLKNHAM